MQLSSSWRQGLRKILRKTSVKWLHTRVIKTLGKGRRFIKRCRSSYKLTVKFLPLLKKRPSQRELAHTHTHTHTYVTLCHVRTDQPLWLSQCHRIEESRADWLILERYLFGEANETNQKQKTASTLRLCKLRQLRKLRRNKFPQDGYVMRTAWPTSFPNSVSESQHGVVLNGFRDPANHSAPARRTHAQRQVTTLSGPPRSRTKIIGNPQCGHTQCT